MNVETLRSCHRNKAANRFIIVFVGGLPKTRIQKTFIALLNCGSGTRVWSPVSFCLYVERRLSLFRPMDIYKKSSFAYIRLFCSEISVESREHKLEFRFGSNPVWCIFHEKLLSLYLRAYMGGGGGFPIPIPINGESFTGATGGFFPSYAPWIMRRTCLWSKHMQRILMFSIEFLHFLQHCMQKMTLFLGIRCFNFSIHVLEVLNCSFKGIRLCSAVKKVVCI